MSGRGLFMAVGRDAPDSRTRRPLVRERHLAYWAPRETAGDVVLAGPMTDLSGSLFVFHADSAEEARRWMAGDPYVLEGVFESFELHPFRSVLPASQWG